MNILDCQGCLSIKKTHDKEARRRKPAESDEDVLILSLGHNFAVDAHQKIGPSKALRRLGDKTQVLTRATINAHVRDRLTHTNEVANISTMISRILGLNENLCLAIAKAHDIGHAPFGHLGEKVISEITGRNFRHEVFGAVISQHIERGGQGLNLTHQVLQGILNHSRGAQNPVRAVNVSEEANAVTFADKIAYIWNDIKDIFERTKILDIRDFPKIKKLTELCGKNQRERISFCVENLCYESAERGYIFFGDSEAAQIFFELKKEMFEVYRQTNVLNGAEILKKVYDFLTKTDLIGNADPAVVLALMTDTDVISLSEGKCINIGDFKRCSVSEIVPYLKDIDFTNPDLSW